MNLEQLTCSDVFWRHRMPTLPPEGSEIADMFLESDDCSLLEVVTEDLCELHPATYPPPGRDRAIFVYDPPPALESLRHA